MSDITPYLSSRTLRLITESFESIDKAILNIDVLSQRVAGRYVDGEGLTGASMHDFVRLLSGIGFEYER